MVTGSDSKLKSISYIFELLPFANLCIENLFSLL